MSSNVDTDIGKRNLVIPPGGGVMQQCGSLRQLPMCGSVAVCVAVRQCGSSVRQCE
jgi:hypothetical protein